MFKITPYFSERLWGSQRLSDYGFKLPKDVKIGEAWVISGYPNKSSMISSGQFRGQSLEWLWNNHPALFNYTKTQNFPILAKILDANKNLSVQVHPNDAQAQLLENDPQARGKDECWYIIDSQNKDLIYGTYVKDRKTLTTLVNQKKWDAILRVVQITAGDFYNIPAGTIHAITAGTLVYELQQSCDITYRFYDYDRLENGKPRALHIAKSIAVSQFNNDTTPKPIIKKITADATLTKLLAGPYFGLANLTSSSSVVINDLEMLDKPFLAVTLLAGSAQINETIFNRGESAILLKTDLLELVIKPINSEIKLMIAWPN